MEVRESFRKTSVSKVIAVVVGTCLAIALGIAGGVAASELAAHKASPANAAPAHNQVIGSFQAPDAQERNQQLIQARDNARMQQLEQARQEKRLGY